MNGDDRRASRDGFSLVEVVIALVILAVGLLALASAMGYVSGRVRAADYMTERSIARQHVIERVRAIPFNNIQDRSYADAWSVGRYKVWWDARKANTNLYEIDLYTEGPAQRANEGTVQDARDTTVVSVVRGVS